MKRALLVSMVLFLLALFVLPHKSAYAIEFNWPWEQGFNKYAKEEHNSPITLERRAELVVYVEAKSQDIWNVKLTITSLDSGLKLIKQDQSVDLLRAYKGANLIIPIEVTATGVAKRFRVDFKVEINMNVDTPLEKGWRHYTKRATTYITLIPLAIGPDCYIATAAYGTPLAREIQVLRDFRDEVLMPNELGAMLVGLYYRTSPPLAKFIACHGVLRTLVREAVVHPVVVVVDFSRRLWRR